MRRSPVPPTSGAGSRNADVNVIMRRHTERARDGQAVLQLTRDSDRKAHVRAVKGQVAALARAHALLAQGRWEGAKLRALTEAELAAFQPAEKDRGTGSRIAMQGPAVFLTPAAAQAFSMALHELATNTAKHGALSVPGGRVALSWRENDASGVLCLRWEEQGGPSFPKAPERRRFGTRVIDATVTEQFGGRVERRWRPEGLVCELRVPFMRALARAERQQRPTVAVP